MKLPKPTHKCTDCGSASIRILSRRLTGGDRRIVFWWHCVSCRTDGGDFTTLGGAAKECRASLW